MTTLGQRSIFNRRRPQHAAWRHCVAVLLIGLLANAAAEPSIEPQVQVEIDASALIEQVNANAAQLQDAADDREKLRQAIEALKQAQQSPATDNATETEADLPPENISQESSLPATGVPLGPDGFSVFTPSADTRTIYVSSTQGNDANPGTSPDTPMRTASAAYKKLRDGKADWLLFKAGETFEGNFGAITKSGKSPAEPMLIGVYGPADAGRPTMLSPHHAWANKRFKHTVKNLAIVGLEFIAPHRDPDQPGFDPSQLDKTTWNQVALSFMGYSENILVEDCRFKSFKFAMVFQSTKDYGHAKNITLRRNIVLDSYGHHEGAVAGHSSGLYADTIDGLTIEECLFDRNGWEPAVPGAHRTIFNHNVYVQMSCKNTAVYRSIFSRGSSHGLQLRSGGPVDDSLFVANALAFFVGHEPSPVTRNVVLQSDDISEKYPRGYGMASNPCADARFVGNIISQKQGSLGHAAAITIGKDPKYFEFLGDKPYRVSLQDNKVYRWPQTIQDKSSIRVETDRAQVSDLGGNLLDAESSGGRQPDPRWVDPERDVESYLASLGQDASFETFIEIAGNRPRGQWDPAYCASAVNDYIREGFALQP